MEIILCVAFNNRFHQIITTFSHTVQKKSTKMTMIKQAAMCYSASAFCESAMAFCLKQNWTCERPCDRLCPYKDQFT